MNDENSEERCANEVIAELTVTGPDVNPDVVTRLTGLLPNKTWLAGDYIGRSERRYQSNGWSLATGKKSEVASAVDELVAMIERHWDQIVSATQDHDVELSIVVYARAFMPAIHIASAQLCRLAELNASIDVDMYDRREM